MISSTASFLALVLSALGLAVVPLDFVDLGFLAGTGPGFSVSSSRKSTARFLPVLGFTSADCVTGALLGFAVTDFSTFAFFVFVGSIEAPEGD